MITGHFHSGTNPYHSSKFCCYGNNATNQMPPNPCACFFIWRLILVFTLVCQPQTQQVELFHFDFIFNKNFYKQTV